MESVQRSSIECQDTVVSGSFTVVIACKAKVWDEKGREWFRAAQAELTAEIQALVNARFGDTEKDQNVQGSDEA
ncbi:hypothetical protein Q0M94_12130 [Deinococcus radiomollis]|uniref:hypothetical protein n=1 Tax=Deinococcus radiomollis TaxID=468916 RepID=UPI003891F5B1